MQAVPLVLTPGKVINSSKAFGQAAVKEMRDAVEELLSVRRVVPVFVGTCSYQYNPRKVQLCSPTHWLP